MAALEGRRPRRWGRRPSRLAELAPQDDGKQRPRPDLLPTIAGQETKRRCLTSESELVLRNALWRSTLPLPLQLRRERKAAGTAAWAAHADQDALLLLFAEIGAVEHDARLLLEQFVQRQIARHDACFVRRRDATFGHGVGGFSRRFSFFPGLRHHIPSSSYAGSTRVSMISIGTYGLAAKPPAPNRRMDCRVKPGNDNGI